MAVVASIAQPSLLDPDNVDSAYPDRAPEAVLQDADRITVHSGNIASWNKLRRRAVLTTTDEARDQKMQLSELCVCVQNFYKFLLVMCSWWWGPTQL